MGEGTCSPFPHNWPHLYTAQTRKSVRQEQWWWGYLCCFAAWSSAGASSRRNDSPFQGWESGSGVHAPADAQSTSPSFEWPDPFIGRWGSLCKV